jgi:uncharacterized damage-inducible protein DinB
LKAFFQEKLEREFYILRNLIELIEEQEDNISDFTKRSISHIINVHHIWNARLRGTKSESDLWDIFPIHHLQRLNQANFTETFDYLEKIELGESIKYHSSEGVKLNKTDIDILFHLLQHSVHHRAQIIADMKKGSLKINSDNFIVFD